MDINSLNESLFEISPMTTTEKEIDCINLIVSQQNLNPGEAGDRLTAMMIFRGLSARMLSEKSGVDKKIIINYMGLIRHDIDLETDTALANALSLPVSALHTGASIDGVTSDALKDEVIHLAKRLFPRSQAMSYQQAKNVIGLTLFNNISTVS